MKISCPACQAKYSIADEKVTDRLAKIRCRKCGATIVIDGKTTPANVYTAAGEAPNAATAAAVEQDAGGSSYSVDLGEGDQRNMTVAEIVAAYNAGQVTAETYLWADGFADWKGLGEIDEIVEALHAATQAPAPAAVPSPAARATATPSPWAAPTATAPRAAARPVRGAAADLFGGIDHAGSEEEVTTSAPEHGGGGHAAAAAAGAGAGASGTGARNESSVLFSLSALTSASSPMAATRPSSRPVSSAASRDDSGLIDLKALTAAATRTEAAPAAPMTAPIMAPPLGLASPLGLGSPLGGGFSASAEPTQAGGKSKTGLYLGIAAILGVAIVSAAVVLKPAPPPPAPPPVAVEAPAPAPTPTPAAVVTAAPPTTGTVDEPAPSAKAATPAAVHHASGGGGVATKKPASAAGGTPAAATPKPAAKHSSCGCAPGDLMCNMQCSAK